MIIQRNVYLQLIRFGGRPGSLDVCSQLVLNANLIDAGRGV